MTTRGSIAVTDRDTEGGRILGRGLGSERQLGRQEKSLLTRPWGAAVNVSATRSWRPRRARAALGKHETTPDPGNKQPVKAIGHGEVASKFDRNAYTVRFSLICNEACWYSCRNAA